MMFSEKPAAVLVRAQAYLNAGLSVIPIRADGSKAPAIASWKKYQQQLPTAAEVESWFGHECVGLAIIAGAVSGGLEVLDFDDAAVFAPWRELVEGQLPGLIGRLPVVETPGPGRHVYYRCREIAGNQRLAIKKGTGTFLTLIETRGEGGYVLAPGCPPACHSTGRTYQLVAGPSLRAVPEISPQEREILLVCARSLTDPRLAASICERGPDEPTRSQMLAAKRTEDGDLPGSDFNRRGPDWAEILTGWTVAAQRGDVRYWRRPGKEAPGYSATTGFCHNQHGDDLLAVFSSNAAPFTIPAGKTCTCYSKFSAYALLHHGGDFSAAARALVAQGYGAPRPPDDRLTARICERGLDVPTRSHMRAAKQPEPDLHLTELGNAQRLVRRHGKDMRFCHPWDGWLVWDGRRWQPDQTAEVVRRAKETIAELYRRASEIIDAIGSALASRVASAPGGANGECDVASGGCQPPEGSGSVNGVHVPQGANAPRSPDHLRVEMNQAKNILTHCLRSESSGRIRGQLQLAQSEPGIPVLPEQLDRDPWLLNVMNGTLDLRTGQLKPHDPNDLLTKLAPVVYNPEAPYPLWEKFLDRILAGNKNLFHFLRRAAGLCLTGDVSEQAMLFLYGKGANGKSTFLQILLALLGDYGMQAMPELLMLRQGEAHPTERADLHGKRLVACIETDENRRLAESLVKQLTGGDRIRARRMREDFWEFEPTHKLILAANHKPSIRGRDHAMWRRIHLVPFTVTITEEEKDRSLAEKLKKELSGILSWCVGGCLEWKRNGLGVPPEVRVATREYKEEMDQLGRFLEERCSQANGGKIAASRLYGVYKDWAEEGRERTMNRNFFGTCLEEHGFVKRRSGENGTVEWYGLVVRDGALY
jgi:P4 family phage/plasmid primase-like protien